MLCTVFLVGSRSEVVLDSFGAKQIDWALKVLKNKNCSLYKATDAFLSTNFRKYPKKLVLSVKLLEKREIVDMIMILVF